MSTELQLGCNDFHLRCRKTRHQGQALSHGPWNYRSCRELQDKIPHHALYFLT